MSEDRNQRIARRAYEIWEREGCPTGRDAEHWHRAEAEIAREEAEAAQQRPAEKRTTAAKSAGSTAKAPAKASAKHKAAKPASEKTKTEKKAPPKAKKADTKKK